MLTSILNVVLWLAMGAAVGWTAGYIMKTNANQGALLNILFGVLGAALGGFGARLLGFSGTNINEGFSVYGFLVSVVGALVVIGVVQLVRRRSVAGHA